MARFTSGQGKIRFDAGHIAIHDQSDGAGRRDHSELGVVIAALRSRITLEAEEGGFRRGLTKERARSGPSAGSHSKYSLSETACMTASRFLIDARAR